MALKNILKKATMKVEGTVKGTLYQFQNVNFRV